MKTATFQNAAGPGRGAAPDVLVSAQWLEAHLHDPGVRVVEVDVSRLAYDEWHIDGAVLWNIYPTSRTPTTGWSTPPRCSGSWPGAGIGPGLDGVSATDTRRPWVSG